MCVCRSWEGGSSCLGPRTCTYDRGGTEVRENIPRNYTRHFARRKKHWLGWSCLRYCVCVYHLSCVYPGGRSKTSFVCVESQQHTLSFFGMGLEVWLPGRGEARRHRSPYRRRLTVVSFHIASPVLDEWRAAVNSQSPAPAARIKPSADRRRRIPTSESMSMSSSNTRHSMDVVDTCRRACASRV